MESSTKPEAMEWVREQMMVKLASQDGGGLFACLPAEVLMETLRESKAVVRWRRVKSAVNLLRLVLAYAVCDWSLRMVGAWGEILGIAHLSDVAVLRCLQRCRPWLSRLIVACLERHGLELRRLPGVRVRLRDATNLSCPGSRGIDWRIHASLDLGSLSLAGVEVTTAKGAESLAGCAPQPEDILVADRGYAYPRSLGAALAALTQVVVRINWKNLSLQTDTGVRFDLTAWLQQLHQTGECQVRLPTPQGTFPLRLIAAPLPLAAAEKARMRAQKAASHKGHTVDPRTLVAAGFILIVTNLPALTWPMQQVLWLYRLRWQIELHFKRYKSLFCLDHLRAKDEQLVQTYLLGKLLSAILIDELIHLTSQRSRNWFESVERPVSLWRLSALFWDAWRCIVAGPLTPEAILAALPALQRYLCDSPRSRPQQLTWARTFLRYFSVFSC